MIFHTYMKGVLDVINERLKDLRREKGYSLEYVAEKINVSRQTVSKWESGETVPDVLKCKELADIYDISMDELLAEKGEDPEEKRTGKYAFGVVRVGERGQIVIPSRARKVFGIGKGDMLLSLTGEPVRLQGALITNDEIVSIVNYVKDNNKAIFDESIENAVLVEHTEQEETEAPTEMEESADEKLLPAIMECFIRGRKASTSMIQTRFALGYARAARIINTIEMRKWIGPSVGAKPREVYMTESQYESVFGIPFGE